MWISLLLLAVSVKQDHTPLKNGCDSEADVVSTLPAGTALTIRFAVSGESVPCYKVSAESAGKTIEGYLPASAINGIDVFDKGVRDAAWLDMSSVMGPIKASAAMSALAPGMSGQGVAGEAAKLIELSQPAKALALIEPQLKKHHDPNLMALAGIAAWRSDDSRRALEYWHTSLELQPNPNLETLVRRVERETKGDQSNEKLFGTRVVLRYESATISVDTARAMLGVLDEEYARISSRLGCQAEERIIAIAQSPAAYRKTVDAAEWSGGQYDGRIRIPMVDGLKIDPALRRTLAHETTHACLTMLGHWPAWLQEGLAQEMSGDQLTPAVQKKIQDWAHAGKLPRLENLHQDWSRLDTEHALAAYALSLAAVEMIDREYGSDAMGNLLRNPQRLAEIQVELDKRFGL
jgi:hypothetical protein